MDLLKRICFTLLFLSLVGCGGGDGSLEGNGDGGGTPDDPTVTTITVTISDTTIDPQSTLTATVLEGDSPLAGKLVTFTIDNADLATFPSGIGTAITDSNGQATTLINAGELSGAGQVTAEVDDADPATVAFISVGTNSEIDLVLSISSVDVSAVSPATITATVSQAGIPLQGELVRFDIDNTDLAYFSPSTGTALTDADGVALLTLHAGELAGSGRVRAGLEDGVVLDTIFFTSAGDGNSNSEPTADQISLFADSQQIASSGSQEILLTAVAKDENNNLLENIEVSFLASSGDLEAVTTTTGADGKATVILKTQTDPSNRVITASAANGSVSDTIQVQVVGTTVQLNGSSALALNDSNAFIVKLLDSDGNGINNTDIQLSLSNESTATPVGAVSNITIPTTVTTDFTGQAIFDVIGTSGGTNTIIADALGASVEHNVSVQADSFLFSSFNNGNGTTINPTGNDAPDVLLSDTATVTLTWQRSGVNVPDGTSVSFTATRGALSSSSGTTVNGQVSTTLTSSNAGKSLVTFTGIDGDVVLNNQLEFEFVAETADSLIAQVSPASIGPSGQTSTVSVVVRDADGNLVKNKTVDFKLTDITNGEISPASAVTDSNGQASTVYTSNTVSAKDGVSIEASVRDTSVNDTVTLTVADRELFISLGTGNSIIEHNATTYNKQYTIFVVDADSNPVENVELTVSAVPNNFYKGYWVPIYDGEDFVTWAANRLISCPNEDLNEDGILDAGEDINGDGELTPENVVSIIGDTTTDENGQVVIDILYAESFAQWVDINLIARAQVTGTESSTHVLFTLPVLAEDVLNEDITPPVANVGLSSPFGSTADCTNTD
ncbi:Ig-like domain-containing protein [Thalassotalea sp. PLHSN55]|uniref:Ig-like domain-containing protein n=1 Tax=Thalassotalea sp. PLHSN55 TaxID=3435888 RepID=UPI003F85E2B2